MSVRGTGRRGVLVVGGGVAGLAIVRVLLLRGVLPREVPRTTGGAVRSEGPPRPGGEQRRETRQRGRVFVCREGRFTYDRISPDGFDLTENAVAGTISGDVGMIVVWRANY